MIPTCHTIVRKIPNGFCQCCGYTGPCWQVILLRMTNPEAIWSNSVACEGCSQYDQFFAIHMTEKPENV